MEHLTEKQNCPKINRVLRSLYRFHILKQDTSCPDILLNLESQILQSALSELNFAEMEKISDYWPSFFKENYIKESKYLVDDIKEFKNYINNLH